MNRLHPSPPSANSASLPPQTAKILVVEDDANLRLVLCDNLEEEGYAVSAASTGPAGLEAGLTGGFDVIILDIMLPGLDGYAICRQLRTAAVDAMVLMLTARSLEDDLVTGLDAGADDFLAKPYRLRELLARVRALCRRRAARMQRTEQAEQAERAKQAKQPSEALTLPGYCIDLVAHKVTHEGGTEVELTRTEFGLLAFLLAHVGEALSRDAILDAVWGEDLVVAPRTVDNFVSNLKRKLAWSAHDTWSIQTVRGVGYRMDVRG